MLQDVGYVLNKLDWLRAERIWPNGERYLWTDAFGVVLYVSLFRSTHDERWLDAAPYPGYGLGAMDAYDGYVSYRLLDEAALAPEIAEMRALIERDYPTLDIEQDLGLGMMLWLRAGRDPVRVHELRGLDRPAGRGLLARAGRAPEPLLRRLSLR